MIKICTKCNEGRPATMFSVDRQKKDGLRPSCKTCARGSMESQLAAAKRWRDRNPEYMPTWKKAYAAKQPKRARPAKDLTAPLRAKRGWKRRNPHKVAASRANRRAQEMRATPAWANKFFMEEAFDLAQLRTKILGFPWHVDHLVPLRSKMVCGLHVEHNLAVIPGRENQSKGNRIWPGMP